jgi:N-acetylmuramoyl-L-alanine amidase
MRKINLIIVHCSATPEGKDYTVEDITRWHKARGFNGIGYHYVVYRDGTIHGGRPVTEIGAHCEGHNANSIGVCYIGGLANDGETPKDTRTTAQKLSLIKLLSQLKKLYPHAVIKGHRDCSPDLNKDGKIEPSEWVKECPSFDAQTEYKGIGG